MTAAVERAITELVGAPYSPGSWGPDSFDCFTLVAEVYRRLGIRFAISDLVAGDILGDRFLALDELLEEDWETVPAPRDVGDIALVRAPLGSDRIPEEGAAGHCAVHIGGHRMLHTTRPHGAHIVPWRLLWPVTLRVVRLRPRMGDAG